MKTFSAKASDVQRQWYVIDAKNRVLGDVAVAAARLLRGKNKPIFTPNTDTGDFVIVINAKEVVFTGRKETNKLYVAHSGYIGGKKVETPASLRQRRPQEIVEHAVRGMVPKNRLGRQILSKLKVYGGDTHPHEAQQPVAYSF